MEDNLILLLFSDIMNKSLYTCILFLLIFLLPLISLSSAQADYSPLSSKAQELQKEWYSVDFPWEFIAVTDKGLLQKIGDITDYGKFIKDSAACIVVLCRDTKYYLEDGCAATENILLAAHSQGIGACWVAGDKKWYCSKIMEVLNVPSGYKLISMIALGYPEEEGPPHSKRSLKEVLHWEKF